VPRKGVRGRVSYLHDKSQTLNMRVHLRLRNGFIGGFSLAPERGAGPFKRPLRMLGMKKAKPTR